MSVAFLALFAIGALIIAAVRACPSRARSLVASGLGIVACVFRANTFTSAR